MRRWDEERISRCIASYRKLKKGTSVETSGICAILHRLQNGSINKIEFIKILQNGTQSKKKDFTNSYFFIIEKSTKRSALTSLIDQRSTALKIE